MLCVAVGHCDTFIDESGEVYRPRKSISFQNMEEEDFKIFFNKCVGAVINRVPEDLVPIVNTF